MELFVIHCLRSFFSIPLYFVFITAEKPKTRVQTASGDQRGGSEEYKIKVEVIYANQDPLLFCIGLWLLYYVTEQFELLSVECVSQQSSTRGKMSIKKRDPPRTSLGM